MSKHSKWSKIKNQKGAADVKKGALFTKYIRAIGVVARQGVDPNHNFQLRMALDAAKTAGVPKDTIDRALARAAGGGEAEELFEVVYEGFAPGKVAIIIEAVTNNKNRTIGNVRQILEKNGGSLAQSGSVAWQFGHWGVIRLNQPKNDELELQLIDLGVEDIKEEDGGLTLNTKPESFQKVLEGLAKLNLKPEYQALEWVPKERQAVTDPELRAKLDKLYELLDGDDDVQNYFTNEE
jgi:YebC/PmpR family DNA-binding regulatory protein